MSTTRVFDDQDSANLYIYEVVQDQTSNNNSNPTLRSFINSLKTIKGNKSILKTMSSSCPICMDDFELDQKLVRLTCRHWFHRNCILPWLNRKSTCPMCRDQLPTEPPFWKEMLEDGTFKIKMFGPSGRVTSLTVREEGTKIRICKEIQ